VTLQLPLTLEGHSFFTPACYHLSMSILRKTKIVATIGPSSSDEKTLTHMIETGMNVARINCSHGTHEEYKANIELIRRVAKKLKMPVAILLDLSGLKIRIGEFKEGRVVLKRGATFTL
jgi:pyruvate kinase